MPRNPEPPIKTRTASIDDLGGVSSLLAHGAPGAADSACVFLQPLHNHEAILPERILDRCMIVVTRGETLLATAGLDLDRCELGELAFLPGAFGSALFETVLSEIEQLAVRFGVQRLRIRVKPTCGNHFIGAGYRAEPGDTAAVPTLSRSLARRLTNYARRVQTVGEALGIPPDYGQRHRLSLQEETARLDSIGQDVFGREQRLAPRAAAAWRRMHHAALVRGIEVQPVSAFRSVDYQQGLLERKLSQGQAMENILKVSAAPGYSEHHSGRAIDVTTPGFTALEESFEHSPAFAWLNLHARRFGFNLSFPRDNRHGLAYEPWHWCWRSPRLK